MRNRRHALGQNFLHSKPMIARITELVGSSIEAAAGKTDVLIEIGPGKLALTEDLDALAKKRSVDLVLIERDRLLENDIRARLPERELRMMDAAGDEFGDFLDGFATSGRRAFVASNLPYSAASQIIANLCRFSGRTSALAGAVVMVQKEMADRICAGPGGRDRGSLSLLVQSYFDATASFDVAPGAFTPPPKVMSTVIVLRPLARPKTADLADPIAFERYCMMLFSQRRKMIRKLVPKEIHELFPKLGISGTERPETLSLETIIELYRCAARGAKAR